MVIAWGAALNNDADINGDNVVDMVIAAPTASPPGRASGGIVYVFYGVLGPVPAFPAIVDFGSFSSGGDGFKIFGAAAGDALGYSVSNQGDINGDGIVDMMIGANQANALSRIGAGIVYVIYGKPVGSVFADIDLAAFNSGTDGFRILGAAGGDGLGEAVSNGGDINGDGVVDMMVSAPNAYGLGKANSGIVYVIYGKAKGSKFSDIDLATLANTDGFKICGAGRNYVIGQSVSNGGDTNKDGVADMVIGATNADPSGNRKGQAYIIYGAKNGGLFSDIDLAGSIVTITNKPTDPPKEPENTRFVPGIVAKGIIALTAGLSTIDFTNPRTLLFLYKIKALVYIKYLQIDYPLKLRDFFAQGDPDLIDLGTITAVPSPLEDNMEKYPLPPHF